MPILVQQQSRLVEVGQIRIGVKKPSSSGKSYPSRLDTFRFTSRLPHLLELLAAKYGGKVRQFETYDKDGKKELRPGEYELIGEAKQIRALFSIQLLPNGDYESLEQWYTHRDPGHGRQMRKCDGITCTTWKDKNRVAVPCLCHGKKLCKPESRVKVFLPHAPDVGTFSFLSHSETFSAEIQGFIRSATALAQPGQYLVPVLMTLTLRHKENAPGETNGNFPVVLFSLDQDPDYTIQGMVAAVQQRVLGPSHLAELPVSVHALPESSQEPHIEEVIVVASRDPREDEALEYLSGLEGLLLDDFKSWAASNGLVWFTAALAAKRGGVVLADELINYIESALEEKG